MAYLACARAQDRELLSLGLPRYSLAAHAYDDWKHSSTHHLSSSMLSQFRLAWSQPPCELALAVPSTNADQNHQQTAVLLDDEKYGHMDSPLWMSTRLQVNSS